MEAIAFYAIDIKSEIKGGFYMKKVMVLGCGVQDLRFAENWMKKQMFRKLSARTTVWQQQKLYAA